MTLQVTGNELVPPNAYEGFFLADVDTYEGKDKKGEEFTSLKWTFDMTPCPGEEEELVIFTTEYITLGSRAGEIISGILGHPIKRGDAIEPTELYRVPLKALVGTRKKENGGEANTISNIQRLGDQPPHALVGEVVGDGEDYDDIPF